MNLKKHWLLVLSCSLFFLSATAQEKYSKVRIPVSSASAKNFVYQNLNLDHYEHGASSIVAVLNSAEMARLRQSGYPFDLMIDDVVQHTLDINRNASPNDNRAAFQNSCQKVASIIATPPSFGTGGTLRLGASAANPGYFKYTEMVTAMQAMQTAHANIASVFTIGNSANGTAIYGIRIGNADSIGKNKPEVLYTGLQHAREAIGGTSLIFFMEYLAENFNIDPRVTELVNNRAIYIIPCLNPDGYAYNYSGASASYPTSGGGLWRKNRRNTGGGASNIGVDLNRNYKVDWGNCSGASSSCGSSTKTDDTYYGPSFFSEPETQALRDFVYSRNFVNAIDQHCYGPYYSLPFGRPSLHPGQLSATDSAYYTYVPALMGLYNGHRAGNSPQTVNYEVAGGIKDWLLLGDIGTGTKGKVFGMTGEAGGGDFWAPVSQIMQLCKELCFQNLQLAYAAGDYYDIQDKTDLAIESTSGKFIFQLKRVGLGASPIKVSLVPIQNIQTVGAPVGKVISNYYDNYIDSISFDLPPTFVCGQKIQFAWKVEAGGITTYDTVTKFFKPFTLLQDDMESGFGKWTSSPSSGASAWGLATGNAFSGTYSMTESVAGNYTASSTRTVTFNDPISLTDATGAYLSFWVRHRAENFRDKLQIQVSNDGGGSWTPICGTTTVSEDNTTNEGSMNGQPGLTGIRPNWTRELFDLSNYLGNASVRIRFRFTSDNDASAFAFEKDDGFNIDDVKLIKTTSISTLAVKFGDFKAQLLSNKTVRLDWEAYTDLQHDYFEVQRATDGASNFRTLERLRILPPYNSFDLKPEYGNNYYRIKEVDKTGLVSYSSVIKIAVQNDISATIYPNPVKKELSVRIRNNVTKDNYVIRVTDATGRTIREQKKTIDAGINNIIMNVDDLPCQVYFLKIINSKNEVIVNDKFIKQ